MNSKQIEFVLEVAQTKNFNRAAENLFVSQPTMTYQIKLLESEIGFPIFDRSPKGAELTMAGEQFVTTLRDVQNQIKKAVEQGQNFSSAYTENIRIMMAVRTSLALLPQAIREFKRDYPSVLVTPNFDLYHSVDSFLSYEQDILIAYQDQVKQLHDISMQHLYTSHLYLLTTWDDPLSQKELIHPEDLEGRTLMVGGGSQPPLRAVQQRLIQTVKNLSYFTSHDHDTSLTNVAAGNAIVISPGYLNDHSGQFAWIPFDCEETIDVLLCTHASDTRWTTRQFCDRILELYQDTTLPL